MTKNEISLELKILQVAEKIFIQKGFTATSTNDIAKEVGCNQALVHYYYRTKDNLFEQIFLKKAEFIIAYFESYQYNGNFLEFFKELLSQYFILFIQNKNLPQFVLNELVINEKRRNFIRKHFIESDNRKKIFAQVDKIVQDAVNQGQIRAISTFDLLLNAMSLVVYTFVILPIYSDWMNIDEEGQNAFLEHRKEVILQTLFNDLYRGKDILQQINN